MNAFLNNLCSADFWLRLLYVVFFALAWQVAEVALAVLVLIQIAYRLFRGEPDADCARWGSSLSQYVWQSGRYLTGASEQKPWPFSEWPDGDAQWLRELRDQEPQ
ncbi:hypothetical protein BXT89_10430 [Halopseudomonas pachastrellae]|uniref:DUF4389 domain-containing protein n=1 Tax=Halopseudomonas pachastrellae TaxID=254161 RepID=A0A1S8DEL2_9GAMM|nr:DUF4389 domain-containing protein [Halopseudomonas pachastrellae]ONM43875.1 hypothetical protein BXT89_10430 [Halopseudomonas pachastrellae]SFM60064.1 protein of unknown function [Halopseudomonas pachastrellae]